NIKIRGDGTVKVLDFGLAKLVEQGSGIGDQGSGGAIGAASMSPTVTSPAVMTGGGGLLGTAAYMSPEQAKGRAGGKRSDLWAFGCVLYEMLSGKRAFDGDDTADTLANVLKSEPDWNALPGGTPDAIRRLLVRCLRKDRKTRIGDPSSARIEIDEGE